MTSLPSHTLPNYSERAKRNALFHYTTGNGLLGILQNNEIWSTAYYCTNDESELNATRNILTHLFRNKTWEMIKKEDDRFKIISSRGVDIRDYADGFEQRIINHTLYILCVYITCFYKPKTKEDFYHGLLSQWRGYGPDGGYAIQFNRTKLRKNIKKVSKSGVEYDLQNIFYSQKNKFKDIGLKHSDKFINAYLDYIDNFINLAFTDKPWPSPIANLTGGPIESLLDFLIHTKNEHFKEERECRMSVLEPISAQSAKLPVNYFNRNGMLVPYVKTPKEFNIIECIDWIIVGPGPRIVNRYNSIRQMVRNMGLKIEVRPSGIPFIPS